MIHPNVAGRAGIAPTLDDDRRCQRCGLAVVDETECCDPDCPYHPADAQSAHDAAVQEAAATFAAHGLQWLEREQQRGR